MSMLPMIFLTNNDRLSVTIQREIYDCEETNFLQKTQLIFQIQCVEMREIYFRLEPLQDYNYVECAERQVNALYAVRVSVAISECLFVFCFFYFTNVSLNKSIQIIHERCCLYCSHGDCVSFVRECVCGVRCYS